MRRKQYEDVLVRGKKVPYYSAEHVAHLEDLVSSLQHVRERYPKGSSRRSDYTRSLGHIRRTLGHIRAATPLNLEESLLRGVDDPSLIGVTLSEHYETMNELLHFQVLPIQRHGASQSLHYDVTVQLREGSRWQLKAEHRVYLTGVYGAWGERLCQHITGLIDAAYGAIPSSQRRGSMKEITITIPLYESCDGFHWGPFKSYYAREDMNSLGAQYNVLSEARYTRLSGQVARERVEAFACLQSLRTLPSEPLLEEIKNCGDNHITREIAESLRTFNEAKLNKVVNFLDEILTFGYLGEGVKYGYLLESINLMRTAMRTPYQNQYESYALIESALSCWNDVKLFTDDAVFKINTYAGE